MNNVHRIQLNLLNTVANFCELHDIHYYLTDGTLIGAIRHNGFIPWDDDIDVAMPRKDYDVFVSTFRTDDASSFFLQTWDTDRAYGYPYAKLLDLNFPVREDTDADSSKKSALFIDIFPVDACPSPKKLALQPSFLLYILLSKALLIQSGYRPWNSHTITRRKWKYFPFLFIAHIVPRGGLKRGIVAISLSWNTKFGREKWRFENVGYNFIKWIFDGESVSYYVKHRFEDNYFFVPKEADEYLRAIYGDYLTLPPESERHGSHIQMQ